jgi:phytoene dehydrogenase-like protein
MILSPLFRDFQRLRWNLLLLVLSAVIGGAAVVAAQRFMKVARQDELRAQNQQSEVRNRLARARDEERDLRSKFERYRVLDAHGLIGQEHRLDWIEQIRKIKQARRLIDLQYELMPQQPLDPTLLPSGGSAFEFMSSTMHMQMQLLHEEDLLNFLNDLRENVTAFVRVRSCSVDRTVQDMGGPTAQLHADCLLDWITLREKK